MTTLHILTHLETLLTTAARIYAYASELFTIGALIWGFNFICGLTDRIWSYGYSFGVFYRNNMHAFCKAALIKIIAALVLASQLAYEAGQYLYSHRKEYLATMNSFRNMIGSWFVYASPATDELVAVDVEVVDPRDYYALEVTVSEAPTIFDLYARTTVKQLRRMAKGLAKGVHKMNKEDLILLISAVD